MLKLGGAVIPMQPNFDKIKVLSGNRDINKVLEVKALPIFDDKVCQFLDVVSKELLRLPLAQNYSDIITFAFFCRKANIKKIKEDYKSEISMRIGRGMVFHIAPGNVAVNFAYSLVAALLAGNPSIVKISRKDFPQTSIIINTLNLILERAEYKSLKPYISIWSYSNSEEDITRRLSEKSSVRIIWGGNRTINTVRKLPLRPKAYDLTFADRCSICVINAEELIKVSDLTTVVRDFYNDTYLMDQNACTSPYLIIWIGKRDIVLQAQERFWRNISAYVRKNYDITAGITIDKLDMVYQVAINFNNIEIKSEDNYIYRVQIKSIDKKLAEFRCAGGLFYEYIEEELSASEFITEQYQTLSYYGYDSDFLREWVINNGLSGIDRIVPMGHTMDFSLIWDGYDLIRTLSRRINTN